jgi:hypothetical protein
MSRQLNAYLALVTSIAENAGLYDEFLYMTD